MTEETTRYVAVVENDTVHVIFAANHTDALKSAKKLGAVTVEYHERGVLKKVWEREGGKWVPKKLLK